ncbi:hypothetical protein FF1_024063 [Malus domestica]
MSRYFDTVNSPSLDLARKGVRLIKEDFGYDDAFHYQAETDFDATLTKYFPSGIDVYLDNVGVEMLEAALNHVNKHAKIPLCGMISGYSKVGRGGEEFDEFNRKGGEYAMVELSHLKEGKIGYSKLKTFHGTENFLESLGPLFTNSNVGRLVIQVK